MPRETDNGFDPAKEQIGSGPWMLEKVESDKAVTLRRNPNYYFLGKPYIDTVQRVVITDTAQNIAPFLAGRLDVYGVPPQQSAEVQKNRPDAQVVKVVPPAVDAQLQLQRHLRRCGGGGNGRLDQEVVGEISLCPLRRREHRGHACRVIPAGSPASRLVPAEEATELLGDVIRAAGLLQEARHLR